MSEMVYVRHEGLDDVWAPRSSLRQLGAQGWAEIEPPEPVEPEVVDVPDQVYVYHEGLDRGAWIPGTALAQHALQGWAEAEPPEREPEIVDVPDTVYVYHEGLGNGAWIPGSALAQHALQGWVLAEPPPPPARNADGTLVEKAEENADPTTDDAGDPASDEPVSNEEED